MWRKSGKNFVPIKTPSLSLSSLDPMDDFSAPSFSLGLDGDFSAPSFSLGLEGDISGPSSPVLDLDLSDLPTEGEEEPEADPSEEQRPPNPSGVESSADGLQDFDEDPGPHALESDSIAPAEDPPPALKRLRRGPCPRPRPPSLPAARPPPAAGDGEGRPGSPGFVNADDEIEAFSSQEERRNRDECSSLPSHATCSSSKFSLHYRGLLTSQPGRKSKDSKISSASTASTSACFEGSSSQKLFPKLTISPLRKFCLVDSDSDDPSSSKDTYKDSKEADASLRTRKFTSSQSATGNEQKFKTESFWKDFSPKKDINLATPILDEFCEEYFRSVKDTKVDHHKEEDVSFNSTRVPNPDDFVHDFQGYNKHKSIAREAEHSWNSTHPQPPAYQYFYHDDSRIRALVRERFRYFVPLGAENIRGNQQSVQKSLDYMGQFGTRSVPSQVQRTREKGSEGFSRKREKKPNSSNSKGASRATEGWVNPKSTASIPKDAGKRRVSADGNQSGHWFTGEDGRKVYVTKNGQELTGRTAYSHYKKENGGFQKSRKKAAGKKRKR